MEAVETSALETAVVIDEARNGSGFDRVGGGHSGSEGSDGKSENVNEGLHFDCWVGDIEKVFWAECRLACSR